MRLSPICSTPWVRHWGDEGWSWNLSKESEDGQDIEGSGMPGRGLVAGAILRWMEMHPDASVKQVASVFNIGEGFALDAMRPDIFSPCGLDEALQVWSLLVGGEVPVLLAAVVFARAPMEVFRAIDAHYYMYVDYRGGVACIGHEGE